MQNVNEFRARNRILLAVKIASQCGQAISISEIELMLPLAIEASSVQETIQTDPIISRSVSIENGFVVLKGCENLFSERTLKETMSKNFRGTAEVFIRELRRRCPYIKLIAVCGSVAYKSAKCSDDIDLFILTEENRMWLTFFKALLLARIFNIKAAIHGERTDFCLSYMQDKNNFEEEMRNRRNSLFAREFLSLYVIDGINCYRDLLEKTSWMSGIFPKLYSLRMLDQSKNDNFDTDFRRRLQAYDSLNLFVYVLLGSFLRIKALLRNLVFRKQRKIKDIFEAKISRGSCVYTSERYRELENLYNSTIQLGESFCSKLNQEKN